ncbi:DUF1236 domain-containing protein [Neorhizobium lilium]|uniref:DUF1236 domain-containing protein n=1 Tax=Neorhizobium lilium TaxID=2503024 RepID=A0A444LDA1_9HYPH|nr:DUF1236 domain-containing protein [Neorhizobium lilium]RWX75826.1 DUF1236 domain-containing protein [Neorhizobium lilium]
MRKTLLAASAAFVALTGAAWAQSTVIIQEPAPAPVVTQRSTVVMPGQVRTYVLEQRVPSVVYEGDVVVGSTLPETVEVHTVDGYDDYAYTVVNEHRVIVDPRTRAVVQVLD